MTSHVVKEGYLCKSPPDDKSAVRLWRNRWFVLRTAAGCPVLEYFENQTKAKLKGTVPLAGQPEVFVVPDYGQPNVFCVKTPKRSFYMTAPTKVEMDQWVQALSTTLHIPVQVKEDKLVRSNSVSAAAPPSAPPASAPSTGLPTIQPPLPLNTQPLPPGWETRVDATGRTYFLDHNSKRTQYEDPRIQTHVAPGTPPQQSPTAGYVLMGPGPPRPHPPMLGALPRTYSTGYQPMFPQAPFPRPPMPMTSALGHLPPGWEQRFEPNGRPYFVNHRSKTTQYQDPRILPEGWEQRLDSIGKTYYLDHRTKITTYDDPRLKASQDQASGNYSSGKGLGSKALSSLKSKLSQWHVEPTTVNFEKKLGEGAFGEVWLAKIAQLPNIGQATGPTTCAVKLVKDREENGSTRSEKEIMDLLREGEIMSKFNHSNVIRLVAVNITVMPYLIISEYMNKGDLKDILKTDRLGGRKWPLRLKLSCALQAAEGLRYLLVEKSFVHRDVAARNILVHEDTPGGELVCKLTDFGLTRDIYESDYYRQSDKKAQLPFKWMAIESMQDHIYNHKTDVWSFGVLLWEIFSMGVNPYPSVDNSLMHGELEAGLRLNKPRDCLGPIYDLILQCTSRSPHKRPAFPLICHRLDEEIAVCGISDCHGAPVESEYANVESYDKVSLLQRAASLEHRMSVMDIRSLDDISGLSGEQIEDILHSNFVPFDASDDEDDLNDALRKLWTETQQNSGD